MLTQKPTIDRKHKLNDSNKDLRKSINMNSFEKNTNERSSRNQNRINPNKPSPINTQYSYFFYKLEWLNLTFHPKAYQAKSIQAKIGIKHLMMQIINQQNYLS